MIEVKNVSFEYESGRKALDDVSFSCGKGERIGLIGANGAGKSTLIKAMLGLIPFDGSIRLFGREVRKENLSEIRSRTGYVLQNSDHQMFMPKVYDDMIFAPRNYGLSVEETEKRIDNVLEQLQITDLKYRYNHKISGGEKKMASIAVILVMNPELIIMDEPTASLDPRNRRRVINAVNGLDATRIITSHDLDMIRETCGRIILLNEGKIAADGNADEILKDQALLESCGLELPLSMQ